MARRTRRAGAAERPPAAAPEILVEHAVPLSPHKRRRLSASANAAAAGARRATPPLTRSAAGALNAGAACASCHRRPARAAELVTCPRCESIVCTVCTRTCTSSGPASLPPTPQLSYSATPVDGSPYGSPQRLAVPLALDYQEAAQAKRRRTASDADETRGAHGHPHPGVALGFGTVASVVGGDGHWAEDLMLGDGCGRTVCKACAVEYEDDDTTTCFDCYGIPLNVPPRPAFAGSGLPTSFDFAFSPDEGTATPALSPSPAPAF